MSLPRLLSAVACTLALSAADQAHPAPAPTGPKTAIVTPSAPTVLSLLREGPRVFHFDGLTLIVGLFQSPGAKVGEVKVLEPQSGRILSIAPIEGEPGLFGASGGERFRISADGSTLDLNFPGQPAMHGAAAPLRYQQAHFTSGQVRLAGRFVQAAGTGRRPALVMVHGGGPGGRDYAYYSLLAAWLADRGVSVLTYDKRGFGESTGADGSKASIPDLAGDAAEALAWVKAQPSVDKRHIGMFGVSQAGWVAPLAAVKAGGVSFLALISPPAVNNWAEEMDETEEALAQINATPAEHDEAMEAMREMYRSAEAGAPSPALIEIARRTEGARWRKGGVDFDPRPSNLAELRRVRYEPAATIRRLSGSLGLFFSDTDRIVPARTNAPLWRSLLAKSSVRDLTIQVFPQANHGLLREAAHGGGGGGGHGEGATVFGPGVLAAIGDWIVSRAGLAPVPPRADGLAQDLAWLDRKALAGDYRLPDGQLVFISAGDGVGAYDLAAGRRGFLGPDGASPTDMRLYGFDEPQRSAETVRFTQGGLVVADKDGTRVASRLHLRTEQITFRSGDADLAGVLVLPDGPGPFPAVVFVHGSGATTRVAFEAWAHYFASRGIAAFAYDKRGTGQSKGVYVGSTFEQLTGDLGAAVALIEARPDIRADRTGIVAISQGGWFAPTLARRTPVAFIVASSAGPVSPAEQERHRRLRKVSDAGFDAAVQARAALVLDHYFAFLKSGGKDHVAEVSADWAASAAAPWFKQLEFPAKDPTVGEWPPARVAFARDLGLDPTGDWAAYDRPALFLLGEADPLQPIARIQSEVARLSADRRDWTVRLFPGADHGIAPPPEPGDIPRTAAGYLPGMVDWIIAHTR